MFALRLSAALFVLGLGGFVIVSFEAHWFNALFPNVKHQMGQGVGVSLYYLIYGVGSWLFSSVLLACAIGLSYPEGRLNDLDRFARIKSLAFCYSAVFPFAWIIAGPARMAFQRSDSEQVGVYYYSMVIAICSLSLIVMALTARSGERSRGFR